MTFHSQLKMCERNSDTHRRVTYRERKNAIMKQERFEEEKMFYWCAGGW